MNLFFCSILTFLFYLHLFTHSLPEATEPALIEDGGIASKKEKAKSLSKVRSGKPEKVQFKNIMKEFILCSILIHLYSFYIFYFAIAKFSFVLF